MGGGGIARRQKWFIRTFRREIQKIQDILGPLSPTLCGFEEGERERNCTLFDIPFENSAYHTTVFMRGVLVRQKERVTREERTRE